jgi:hypothetical protein
MKAPAKSRIKQGIVVPKVVSLDTGIHEIRQLTGMGSRYRLWYLVNGKRKYVILPKGVSIEEARVRRDHLHKNLRERYGAKRTDIKTAPRKKQETLLTPEKFIYRRPPLVIRIMGKQIGEAQTWKEAERIRNTWLKNNVALVPQLAKEVAKL